MKYGIKIATIGTSDMDDIAIKNLTVFFIKTDPFFDECFCFRGIIELRTAVTGLYTGSEKIGQPLK